MYLFVETLIIKGDYITKEERNKLNKMFNYEDNPYDYDVKIIGNVINTDDPEILDIINNIIKLIEPMDDNMEENIKTRINNLLLKYEDDLRNINPNISFDKQTSITLENKSTPEILKVTLISELENIINLLYEQERLVNLLNKIDNYKKLIDTYLDFPENTNSTENKIMYIIYMGETKKLEEILNIFSNKISLRLANSFNDEVKLTLETEEKIEMLFNESIKELYETVRKYDIITSSIEGAEDNELSRDLKLVINIINQCYETDKNKYEEKLERIEDSITIELCEKKTLEELELLVRENLKQILEEINKEAAISIAYKDIINDINKVDREKIGVITNLIYEIENLLGYNNCPKEVTKSVKEEINKILDKYKMKMLNKEKITSRNELFNKFDDSIKVELEILKELYGIKFKSWKLSKRKRRIWWS